MPHEAEVDDASRVELMALARLAVDPEIVPPPHLRHDLEAKGWVMTTEVGPTLTGRGREIVELA